MIRTGALLLLALLLVACGDLEFVTPSPEPPEPLEPPYLAATISVTDTMEMRIVLDATLTPGRGPDGSPLRVLDPTLRMGELILLPVHSTEELLHYRAAAVGPAARTLLASALSGPVQPPLVRGATAPTLTLLEPMRRAGAAEVVWSEPGDLVLGLDVPPGVQARADVLTQWALALYATESRGIRTILTLHASGRVPTEIRVPAVLVGPCTAGRIAAEMRFAAHLSEGLDRDGYRVTALTQGSVWWEVIRECG